MPGFIWLRRGCVIFRIVDLVLAVKQCLGPKCLWLCFLLFVRRPSTWRRRTYFFYISVLYNWFSSQPLKFSLFSIKFGLYNRYFLYFPIVLHFVTRQDPAPWYALISAGCSCLPRLIRTAEIFSLSSITLIVQNDQTSLKNNWAWKSYLKMGWRTRNAIPQIRHTLHCGFWLDFPN